MQHGEKYYCEYGNVAMSMSVPAKEVGNDEMAFHERVSAIPALLVEKISTFPNIAIKYSPRAKESASFDFESEDGQRVFVGHCISPIAFDIHLPKKLQPRIFPLPRSARVAEDFSVLYDGFLFAVFCKSDPAFRDRDIGYVVKKYLEETVLAKLGEFSPLVIGPSPLHIGLEVAFEKVEKGALSGYTTFRKSDKHLCEARVYYESDQEFTHILDVGEVVWQQVHSALASFYRIATIRNRALDFYLDALNRFGELQDEYVSLIGSNWYELARRHSKEKAVMRAAADVHNLLAAHSVRVADLEDGLKSFREHMDGCSALAPFEDYFLSMSRAPQVNYGIFLSGLEHVRSHLLSSGQNKWLLIAALVGSAVALSGTFLSYFLFR